MLTPFVRYLCAAAAAALAGILFLSGTVCCADPQQFDQRRDECTWATQWINNGLSLFMARGYVEKITAKDDGLTMFVGAPWHRLSFAQQGEFLRNFARSREIIGHDPSCTVLDGATGAIVARVAPNSIELLTPAGDFQPYHSTAAPEQPQVE